MISRPHELKLVPAAAGENDDPLLEEIRAIKRSISERFDHDVRKLGEHLLSQQALNRDRLLSRDVEKSIAP